MAGLAVIVVLPLNAAIEISDSACLDAIGLSGVPVEVESQLQARRARDGPHRVEPRRKLR